jgi:hypothetical protein
MPVLVATIDALSASIVEWSKVAPAFIVGWSRQDKPTACKSACRGYPCLPHRPAAYLWRTVLTEPA